MLQTFFTILVFWLLGACSQIHVGEIQPNDLEISEIEPDRQTALMKQNILHLAQVYDLGPFLYTKKINITSDKNSQSHPVLTLSSRFAENPNKALSLWLHGEFHWWATQNPDKMRAAIKDLEKVWPQVPLEGISRLKVSTYSHLIICWLEHEALNFYLGSSSARSVLEGFIKKDKLYPWANSQVLNNGHVIRNIVQRHALLPPPLK